MELLLHWMRKQEIDAKMVNVMNASHIIHKLVAYKCPKCSKWHIGKSNTILSEKNREKLMK